MRAFGMRTASAVERGDDPEASTSEIESTINRYTDLDRCLLIRNGRLRLDEAKLREDSLENGEPRSRSLGQGFLSADRLPVWWRRLPAIDCVVLVHIKGPVSVVEGVVALGSVMYVNGSEVVAGAFFCVRLPFFPARTLLLPSMTTSVRPEPESAA